MLQDSHAIENRGMNDVPLFFCDFKKTPVGGDLGGSPIGIQLGDMDGDGDLDIVLVGRGPEVYIIENRISE